MTLRFVCACAFALMQLSCGGSTDTPRPERPQGDVPPGECRPILPLSDAPDDGGLAADCSALDGYEFYVLSTFELGMTPANFYFNTDRTADQEPPPDAQGVPTTKIPGGRCVGAVSELAKRCPTPETPRGECNEPMPLESRYAMNIRSGNLTNSGGVFGTIRPKQGCLAWQDDDPATLDVDEYAETHCKFKPASAEVGPCSIGEAPAPAQLGCSAIEDTSDWEGVMVWARVAPNSPSSIRLRASDAVTDDKACYCNPYTNQNDASDGCDKFGKFVNLDNTFRAYFIPFAEMQQGGWGLVSPALDHSNIFEIVVEYGRGAWDLWIDDMAYYRRRP